MAPGIWFTQPLGAQDNGSTSPAQQTTEHPIRQGLEGLVTSIAARGEGITPLMGAARSNDVEELERQIAGGADVNETSRHGWTALMFAAWQGHAESVERLLDAGADPNMVSKRITGNTQAPTPRTTALAQATESEHIDVAFMLLARGAVADPISVAIAGGAEDLSLIREMRARGADLSRYSGVMYYPSALSVACGSGRLKNVEWLIDNGATPDLDALFAAVGGDELEIVAFLVTLNTERGLYSEQDLSAAFLHAATKNNTKPANYDRNLQVIELLLAHGADRNYRQGRVTAEMVLASHKEGRVPQVIGNVSDQTALEFLREQRVQAVERIKLNRYGENQQAWEKGWLKHRDAIIELLET
ncbi:MAG: ankyrin repeat domain-containing protein [Xanthomonadales bacterium]|nr:ankyrin repeat domain-containing protein [Xanthomonadales bacterium]